MGLFVLRPDRPVQLRTAMQPARCACRRAAADLTRMMRTLSVVHQPWDGRPLPPASPITVCGRQDGRYRRPVQAALPRNVCHVADVLACRQSLPHGRLSCDRCHPGRSMPMPQPQPQPPPQPPDADPAGLCPPTDSLSNPWSRHHSTSLSAQRPICGATNVGHLAAFPSPHCRGADVASPPGHRRDPGSSGERGRRGERQSACGTSLGAAIR
jgi:hypothetical protein